MVYKNMEFRRKNMRGSKVDDLYIYLENIKDFADKETVENIQKFIEKEMDYKPVRKRVVNS